MKPRTLLASAVTPGNSARCLTLYRHDNDFFIAIGRDNLMSSREHESELELARRGCARITAHPKPAVLIGGLGMGYTLRQALDMLKPSATVVVAELMPAVIQWNRDILGGLTGHPLRDRRVTVRTCDVADLILESESAFDAILLDLDNGPEAFSHAGNHRIYGRQGILACMRALRPDGCLAIWSATVDLPFERQLSEQFLRFRLFRSAAHKGGRTRSRCVWVISRPQNGPAAAGPVVPRPDRKKMRRKGGGSRHGTA